MRRPTSRTSPPRTCSTLSITLVTTISTTTTATATTTTTMSDNNLDLSMAINNEALMKENQEQLKKAYCND
eukprot:13051722-Heterocapsa_arctica.AAC.1